MGFAQIQVTGCKLKEILLTSQLVSYFPVIISQEKIALAFSETLFVNVTLH